MATTSARFVRWLRLIASVGIVILLAAGCGRVAGLSAGGQGAARIGIHDSGRSLTLHRGQHLLLSLGNSGHNWPLASYPKKILSLQGNDNGSFDFVARSAGTGQIVALDTSSLLWRQCRPGPVLNAAQVKKIPCPLVARLGGERLPLNRGLFVVTVLVR